MRKLTLSLDALDVQSFDTEPLAARGRGTVHGRGILVGDRIDAQTHPDCPSPLCQDTPLASCDGTCGAPGCGVDQPIGG